MGFRTLSVDDSTYDRLSAAKREGESFAQLFRRLLAPRPRLVDFRKAFSKDVGDEVAEALAVLRRNDLSVQAKRRQRG